MGAWEFKGRSWGRGVLFLALIAGGVWGDDDWETTAAYKVNV